jgi:diguanylate cyclase (GGDEF)-like protein
LRLENLSEKAIAVNLQSKVSAFSALLAAGLTIALLMIGLYSFRQYSIATATEHIRSSAEIVRVSLTEAMINGVIGKRESFLQRLTEVQGLRTTRVIRGPQVEKQFGGGLAREAPADDIERQVVASGKAVFDLDESGPEILFRGTIPFVANSHGQPNCLQCHQVADGEVLGAVTLTMSIDHLRQKALWTLSLMMLAVGTFVLATFAILRRVTQPIAATAASVETAVQRAIDGDFKTVVEVRTKDEIGQIAVDLNRLLAFLDKGLNHIGYKVAQLTNHPINGEGNLLDNTIRMVETLTEAAHFKQAIEEDQTKEEIYDRLARVIEQRFGVPQYSIYEVLPTSTQMLPMRVDGVAHGACRWCDPQILIRNETCRARRTGHLVDGVATPDICYAFKQSADGSPKQYLCFPLLQSGAVGGVMQLVLDEANAKRAEEILPQVEIYLRETAPVLEAKRLMETLKEANLRDPMTGLHNRRFLEESVENLISQCQRHKQHMSILMADLDYFKMVNDTHGHDAGDAVLKALAKVLVRTVRGGDYVIRYGGEEFLILLQETDAGKAVEVAEKIRLAVEEMKVSVGAIVLQKTISIGLADFPSDSDTFWQALKFADVALYHAKESGRNRVVRFVPALWDSGKGY